MHAECDFAFIPSEGLPILRITSGLRVTEDEELVTVLVPMFNHSDNTTTLVDARVVIINNTLQIVNRSFCQITSLEVYRGSRSSTVISHNGFTLSNRGTLEVTIIYY